jgi:hypothetical protein
MPKALCGFIDGPDGTGQALLIQYGPALAIDIGFDPTYKMGDARPPDLAIKDVYALVDTSTTESCIDNGLAISLKLPLIDRRMISGVGGREEANVYMAQIYCPALSHVIYGRFFGVDLAAAGQSHMATVGRTYLREFTMEYNGQTGEVSLSRP